MRVPVFSQHLVTEIPVHTHRGIWRFGHAARSSSLRCQFQEDCKTCVLLWRQQTLPSDTYLQKGVKFHGRRINVISITPTRMYGIPHADFQETFKYSVQDFKYDTDNLKSTRKTSLTPFSKLRFHNTHIRSVNYVHFPCTQFRPNRYTNIERAGRN
jgi:hypothetical protein